ncbi:MAG TPA: M28 family peptidase [Coriobacteriia bacterium]|nr:M28 family peptidase [Coriobacteriia bacterium]
MRRLLHHCRVTMLAAVVAVVLSLLIGCADPSARDLKLRLSADDRVTSSAEVSVAPPTALAEPSRRLLSADPEERFNAGRALDDARALTAFGVRPGGSRAERRAAEYIERRLRSMGYRPSVETFELPNGKTSRNVIATAPGAGSDRTIIVGAHFDTKPPSPGANDNASGCGVALELARLLAANPAAANVQFVFFGTEEYLLDAPGDNHHLGSRFHAKSMTDSEVGDAAAMLSIDMVGYGTRQYVRSMERGPRDFVEIMLAEAKRKGVQLSFRKDPGATGWSDHEPYEDRGIPVAWLQWLEDPVYHTAEDDADHIQRRPIAVSGKLALDVIRDLGPDELERLCDR